jgi:hypothetical protein
VDAGRAESRRIGGLSSEHFRLRMNVRAFSHEPAWINRPWNRFFHVGARGGSFFFRVSRLSVLRDVADVFQNERNVRLAVMGVFLKGRTGWGS